MAVVKSRFYPTSLYYEIRDEICKILNLSKKSKNGDEIHFNLVTLIFDKTNVEWNDFYSFLDWLKSSVSSLNPLGARTSKEKSAIESRLNELLVLLRSYSCSLRDASK